MSAEKQVWKAVLATTPDCLSPEHFESTLSERAAAHLSSCPRCQAEFAMWQSFESNQPIRGDGAAVQWIAAELNRRAEPRRKRWLFGTGGIFGWRAVSAALSVIVVAFGIGLLLRNPRTGEPLSQSEPVYRSSGLNATSPRGDLATAPVLLQWEALPGVSEYRVQVMEVDHTVLWTGKSTSTSVRLPASVRALAVPGKTLLWQVVALGASGKSQESSPLVRFRVKTKHIPADE